MHLWGCRPLRKYPNSLAHLTVPDLAPLAEPGQEQLWPEQVGKAARESCFTSPFQGHFFLSHTQISSFSYQKIGEKQKHPYLEPPLHFILSVMMGRNKIWMGPTYQDPRGSLKGQKGSYKRTCLSPRAKGYSQTVLKSLFKSYVAWISCILRSNKANCYKPLLRIFFPHNLRVNVIKDSLINESRLTGVSLLHETISCYEILVHVPELSGLVVTE